MSVEIVPSRRETGDDRRVAIAQAARRIIIEKGLEGLRTRDIAARVGINIATLHYHVPGKAALIELVADSLRHCFREQSLRHPLGDRTGLQLLHCEFGDFRETVVENPELIIILTELVERSRRDAAVAAIMLPMLGHWRNQFAVLFRLGIADGSSGPTSTPRPPPRFALAPSSTAGARPIFRLRCSTRCWPNRSAPSSADAEVRKRLLRRPNRFP